MTNMILTALCAITLGMHSPAIQDTTVSYTDPPVEYIKLDVTRLENGKAKAYKVRVRKSSDDSKQQETWYYVDDQIVSESDYKKINSADIKQILFYKAGSEAAMILTGSAQIAAVKVTLKEDSLAKVTEELDEVLVVSYGRKKVDADLYKTNEKVTPMDQVDVKPKFQGGDVNSFVGWVNKRLMYPEAAIAAGVQGRVVVTFKVNSDGKVSDVEVLRGVCDVLDQAAVSAISASPAWTPAKRKGKNVAVSFTFPVIFALR